jgi:hypothetical protein
VVGLWQGLPGATLRAVGPGGVRLNWGAEPHLLPPLPPLPDAADTVARFVAALERSLIAAQVGGPHPATGHSSVVTASEIQVQ